MKKLYFLISFFGVTLVAYAQNPDAFITTWEVTSGNLSITVPIPNNGQPVNYYTIDFGDGEALSNQTEGVTHLYDAPGVYTVTITGIFHTLRMGIGTNANRAKLKSIEQWGTNVYTTMREAYKNCPNLVINATDAPNLSQVTDMVSAFEGATSLNQSIDHWDVSNVTNMERLFFGATSFNQPLNNWDVSNVTNMLEMFTGATAFNQPLNNWDVSNVTDMSKMFQGLIYFNQDLNTWNVENVTLMNNMFKNAESFNQPLNNWDVSNVYGMGGMFYNASSFNQDLSGWNFKNDVHFGDTVFIESGFIGNTALSIANYDALLNKFVLLQLPAKQFYASGLEYCNENAHYHLILNGWHFVGDTLSENCGDNSITGTVFYDQDNNGCDSGDMPVTSLLIRAENSLASSITTADTSGQYTLNVNDGAYSVGLVNLPEYFTVTPPNSTVNFTGADDSETLNFCLTTTQNIQDLNITLLPVSAARPGFESEYQVVVQNMGTQTVSSAEITFVYDNTKQNFISAIPAAASTSANQLNFSIGSLLPFEVKTVDLVMQTFAPPTVNGDDILNFNVTVSPNTNDYTPLDNSFELGQIVVNSYDPNDKQVLQGNAIHLDEADEYLHYIVRFQNTGTASAITVKIDDVLDETLNWNTFQIINSSHNYRVEITEDNQVEFIFEDINLPYQSQDEAGSNGFIAYKIKPAANTVVGDIITGNAAFIYFDFNTAIITNAVITEVVDTMGTSQYAIDDDISVYPNPTDDILNVQTSGNIIVEGIELYNLQGRKLLSINKSLETINLNGVSPGLYIVNIKTNLGSITKRIIRK